MSEGIRSGVNCTRRYSKPSNRESALATRVLPTPGTPSSRACPPQRKVPMSCSSRSCWPAKTRSRPPRIASACWRIRSSSIKLLSQCDQFPSECAHGCRICRPVAAFNKAFPLTQQLLQFRLLMAAKQADGADAADDALHRQGGRPGSLIEKGRRLHVLAGRAPLGDHKRFGRPEADIAAEEINANQHGRNQTEGAGPRQCQQKSGERFDAAVPVSILVEAEHASPHFTGENRGQGVGISRMVKARIRPGKIVQQNIDRAF